MRLLRLAWIGPAALMLLALVPSAGAYATVGGVVTTCSTRTSCDFVFNTSTGTGWANATNTRISFQLPGEAKASNNLSYTTYIGSLIGTYTYWTVGSFLGTDVNSGKVVYGTTDTNYTITCHGHSGRGGGCTYTYTTDNGTVVFHLTQAELTSTSVACSPTSVRVGGGKTTCTVKVTDLWNSTNVPTGTIHLASGRTGTFSNKGVCTLASGQCSVTWRPFDATVGPVTITAKYLGTAAFWKSTGTTSQGVTGGG
ncbi:MAG: hypothetical protein L3K09_03545 [Thermoplasmata archaeon]|nr:hypothetical protein [Thermoplasmata archaeon]